MTAAILTGFSIGTIAGVVIAAAGLGYTIKRGRISDKESTERRSKEGRDVAREEALDLAKVRGEAIEDLHKSLAEVKLDIEKERADHLEALGRLQGAVDLAREQALETQQMLAHGMRGLLMWIQGQLENDPPRVDVVVRQLRLALADSDPIPPGQRRRAS